MSGFPAQWLALRERADDRARAASLIERLAASFSGAESVAVVDLGAGGGANLRALAGRLPARQTWRLVDWDETLLDAARGRLVTWADEARAEAGSLRLRKEGRDIDVHFARIDLARDMEAALAAPVDLVAAAAFFDLVSAPWMDEFCASLARRKLPLYATLIYDGQESWDPPHAADAQILAAFHAHQGNDKGFGPAAGPFAAAHLARTLEDASYRVDVADSPWILSQADADLMRELAHGEASAVAETGFVPPEARAAWLDARSAARACRIGHKDVFATPL